MSRVARPPQPESYEHRRPASLNRRDPSPGQDGVRAAVAVGRSVIGAGPRRTSSRDRGSAAEASSASSAGQKLGSRPPLLANHPRSQVSRPPFATDDTPAPGVNTRAPPKREAARDGDSLMDLLHKPLLPQNGPLYERLADQLLESRQPRGRTTKPLATKAPAPLGALPNYDDEARKLWARLNLDPVKDTNSGFNSLDPVWRHPDTGGTIYVGNEVAAKSLKMLQDHKITHVVNCTDSIPLYHEKQPGAPITYMRFDITSHYHRARSEKEAVVFVQPMLDFVNNAVSRGKNVMVHCLAGAHRAGTTGILCLMHFAKLAPNDATYIAKQCRPIIDPICDFPLLLARVERGWYQQAHPG